MAEVSNLLEKITYSITIIIRIGGPKVAVKARSLATVPEGRSKLLQSFGMAQGLRFGVSRQIVHSYLREMTLRSEYSRNIPGNRGYLCHDVQPTCTTHAQEQRLYSVSLHFS